MPNSFKPTIHVFYCVNAFEKGVFSPNDAENADFVHNLKLACSAMIKDVYILKAFECGADGAIVIGCPAGKCKRVDGNIRAGKRVAWVQKLLDEIGLGGKRLVYAGSDQADAAISQLLKEVATLGPNPIRPGAKSTAK
jgi:coenzyme F420-reducing hydrogenase delta subunit